MAEVGLHLMCPGRILVQEKRNILLRQLEETTRLTTYLHSQLKRCLSLSLSVCVCASVCLSVCLSECLCVCTPWLMPTANYTLRGVHYRCVTQTIGIP